MEEARFDSEDVQINLKSVRLVQKGVQIDWNLSNSAWKYRISISGIRHVLCISRRDSATRPRSWIFLPTSWSCLPWAWIIMKCQGNCQKTLGFFSTVWFFSWEYLKIMNAWWRSRRRLHSERKFLVRTPAYANKAYPPGVSKFVADLSGGRIKHWIVHPLATTSGFQTCCALKKTIFCFGDYLH